jgi:hypothetical protein
MFQVSSQCTKKARRDENGGLTYTWDIMAIGSSKYRQSLTNASPSFLSSFLDPHDLTHSRRTLRAQRMRHSGAQVTSRPVSAMTMGKRVSTALTCCLTRGYDTTAADNLRMSVLMNLSVAIQRLPCLKRSKPCTDFYIAFVQGLWYPAKE